MPIEGSELPYCVAAILIRRARGDRWFMRWHGTRPITTTVLEHARLYDVEALSTAYGDMATMRDQGLTCGLAIVPGQEYTEDQDEWWFQAMIVINAQVEP